LAFDQNSSRTLLFGGYIAHLTAINDTWEYGIPCTELEITVTDGEGVEHPGYSTIQEAVDSVTGSGWVISVGSGEFDEYPIIIGKDNLMIKTACDAEIQGLDIRQCTDILIEGFEIVPTGLGKHGIDLNGGISRNIGVTIANCDIHGADNSYSGIAAWRNTEDLTVTGCHIYENGRNGVVFLDATGGPHYLTGNLIENNGWNGVRVAYAHYITLTSNVINNNGTKTGITGGRYGVLRGAVNGGGYPERITLLNNEIRYNHGNVVLDKSSIDLGNYHQMLDEGDSGNITTGGDEGPGVSH
jgi:parallel beta-helix repeat protein